SLIVKVSKVCSTFWIIVEESSMVGFEIDGGVRKMLKAGANSRGARHEVREAIRYCGRRSVEGPVRGPCGTSAMLRRADGVSHKSGRRCRRSIYRVQPHPSLD